MFSEVLNLRPSVLWRNVTGARKLISRFSNQTAWRIDRKTTNSNIEDSYNPFLSEVDDTTLVSLNSSFRSMLYFNRTHTKFGIDLKYLNSRTKALLVNGLDTRGQQLKSVYLRWNITRQFTWNILYAIGEKSNYSEFFSTPKQHPAVETAWLAFPIFTFLCIVAPAIICTPSSISTSADRIAEG